MLTGHADIVVEQLCGVSPLLAGLVKQSAPAEAVVFRFDQDQRNAFGAIGNIAGHGYYDHQICLPAVGDERLGAVDDVVVAIPHRARLRAKVPPPYSSGIDRQSRWTGSALPPRRACIGCAGYAESRRGVPPWHKPTAVLITSREFLSF
ncbi:hypothetical protein CCUG62472_00936 [Mycobacteroides salmoniphilum]|nr:hypothetical protein CCUG62472_00936 [Mycobacteroides salmoniphilum]